MTLRNLLEKTTARFPDKGHTELILDLNIILGAFCRETQVLMGQSLPFALTIGLENGETLGTEGGEALQFPLEFTSTFPVPEECLRITDVALVRRDGTLLPREWTTWGERDGVVTLSTSLGEPLRNLSSEVDVVLSFTRNPRTLGSLDAEIDLPEHLQQAPLHRIFEELMAELGDYKGASYYNAKYEQLRRQAKQFAASKLIVGTRHISLN